MAEFGEQLELEFDEFDVAEMVTRSADKPGSFLMALREAYYAGFDFGTAYADGYVDEDDTTFELWYASKFFKGMQEVGSV